MTGAGFKGGFQCQEIGIADLSFWPPDTFVCAFAQSVHPYTFMHAYICQETLHT